MSHFTNVIDDVKNFANKKLFALLFLLAYFILMAYALVRPASNSVLISAYGEDGLVYAWIITALLIPLFVYGYNYLISIFRFTHVFTAMVLLIMGLSFVFRHCLETAPKYTALALYIWKDIYILILVEQVWVLCNTTYSQNEGKTFYGLLTASGSLGAITGNLFTQYLSKSIGSYNLILLSVIPHIFVLILFLACVRVRNRDRRVVEKSERQKPQKFSPNGGFAMVFSSRYLLMIFCVIGLIQLITSLTDYQLNAKIKEMIQNVDERTAYIGKVYTTLESVAFVCQIFISALLLRYWGLFKTHVAIPMVSLLFITVFTIVPHLFFISMAFISVKSLDYSLFRAAKEILYMPLSEEVQYKSKSVIDIFSYRACKAISSMIILGLKQLPIDKIFLINCTMIGAFLLWLILIASVVRKFSATYRSGAEEGP